MMVRDLPGGPVVKTAHFHYRGHGFDLWSGIELRSCMPRGQKRKKKNDGDHRNTMINSKSHLCRRQKTR